jgi:predicted metal-dependent phosphoesterase TrpH
MSLRLVSATILGVGVIAGTIADRSAVRPEIVLGGYRVLSADFHNHSSTWSDGALTPWGLVLEATRQGLDVIAITGHNEVLDAKVGRWFASHAGGPTVLVGQEILSPGHHVIGVGTEQVVDSRLSVAQQVEAIHGQGGVAIAAHPVPPFWPAFDDAAMQQLDGAEICHPLVYGNPEGQRDLEQFLARKPLTAVGSSDFHGSGRMGLCRTYVFARDASAEAVLEALRARRTVVYAPEGKVYGDPALVPLAEEHPELRDQATRDAPPGALDWVSRLCGVVGLIGWSVGSARRYGLTSWPSNQ